MEGDTQIGVPKMIDERSEQAWASALRQGRPEAWLALYDAYATLLWRRVARLSHGDSAAVADVVQSTLLAAAESAPTGYDPARGSVWAWLCGIARNQLALHRRRVARLPPMTIDAGESWPADLAEEPPAQLQSRELAGFVRDALSRLPAEYEALLVDRYVDGMSAEQIGRRTGTTGQSVRSKLCRARRALQVELQRLAPSAFASEAERPRSQIK
jgi:RNA polymerase sigma-70 factor (ECF subfamily)